MDMEKLSADLSSEQLANKIVQRTKEQVFRDLGGKTVILNLANNRYYELNEVGTRIWQLLEYPVSIKAICDTLLHEYEVTPETCNAEVFLLLNELEDNSLIQSDSEAEDAS